MGEEPEIYVVNFSDAPGAAEYQERHERACTEAFARPFVGSDRDDKPIYEERELDEGDVIAHGTTDVEGYGTMPVERAKFIVDTIRLHLAREACKLHAEDLSSIEALLGREVRWCPCCGIRMSTGRRRGKCIK